MIITNALLIERMQRLENKSFSQETIERYFTNIKLFMEWWKHTIGTTMSSENLTLVEIEKRKTTLRETLTPKNSIYYTKRPTLSPHTIQWKIVAIKSLLKYLNYFHDEWIDYRRLEIKKCKSDYIEYITENEFRLFMNFIGEYEHYKINALRSQLLCNIGYTSWLRLSEMLHLTIDEIKRWECRITGKWNKTRRVFFTPTSERLLNEYLEEREKPIPRTWIKLEQSDLAFVSHNVGKDSWPLKKNTICERIKKYSDLLNIWKRITVHSLRHSYATKLLESWMNIREIQELLGHCDIQTTEWYCHVLKSWLKNKVSQIFE